MGDDEADKPDETGKRDYGTDRDRNHEDQGQLSTRVEAFIESIKVKKRKQQ